MNAPVTIDTDLRDAAPTPADLTITVRDERFNRGTSPRRWWAGEPFGTAWHNALSATFPRGEAFFIEAVKAHRDVVREGTKVAILSLGARLEEAKKAADQLEAKGLSTTVADMRFAKPLDTALIEKLMRSHEVVVTVEEGAIGGLGAHVLTFASDEGLTDAGLKVRTMRLPDIFQDQDDPDKQYDEAGLNAPHIVDTVLNALRHNSAGVEEARA